MGYITTSPSGLKHYTDFPEEKRSCGDCSYDTFPEMCDLCLETDVRNRPLWELKDDTEER